MTSQPSLSLSEISANGVSSRSIFTEIFKKLRKTQTATTTLQGGVEIIYQILKCDRAVVYSLQSDAYAKIIAEAVTPGYTQTLGTTIKDPCFEAGYSDKYRRGRVRAITDIYQGGINPCHIETLEQIEVKSNLVVPLVREDNSLFGLLVMHQCSTTREWQQSEVEFVLEVASWLMAEISRQEANAIAQAQIAQMKQARGLINAAIQGIHGAQTSLGILQQSVEQAQAILQCDRVVVYCLQQQQMGQIVAETTTQALAPILGNIIQDPCFEYRYLEQYQQGRIRAIANIFEAGMSDCYVNNLAKIGVKSNLVAPITWDNGKIYGLLVAHQCFDFKDWQELEIEHFQDLALHTGLSLSKAKIKEQAAIVETGLGSLNQIKTQVNLAQSKINQTKQSMRDTSNIMIEIANLYKLLERELNQINQTGSLQTKKDTKLIQIITRKLIAVTSKLKQPLSMVNINGDDAKEILTEAIAHIDGEQNE